MDISIQDLSVSYPSNRGLVRVLRHANLYLPSGKITALVGESGSGKSILGAAVMGLLEKDAIVSGHICYGRKSLLAQSEEAWQQIRGTHIGWIAQDPIAAMDPMQVVGKQVTEGICFRNHHSAWKEKVQALRQMARFGLPNPEEVYEKYPCELSGGMAQRVLSAMVDMPHPEWMVADEPTKGLDAFVRRELCQLFRMFRKKGTGFLFITHDIRLAEKLSDYIGIIYAGEILEYGKTEEVFSHPFHPYTKSFLEAQPRNLMKPIPGLPPNLSNLPDGCIFKNRCSRYDKGDCERDMSMRQVSSCHQVRCWREDT